MRTHFKQQAVDARQCDLPFADFCCRGRGWAGAAGAVGGQTRTGSCRQASPVIIIIIVIINIHNVMFIGKRPERIGWPLASHHNPLHRNQRRWTSTTSCRTKTSRQRGRISLLAFLSLMCWQAMQGCSRRGWELQLLFGVLVVNPLPLKSLSNLSRQARRRLPVVPPEVEPSFPTSLLTIPVTGSFWFLSYMVVIFCPRSNTPWQRLGRPCVGCLAPSLGPDHRQGHRGGRTGGPTTLQWGLSEWAA